MTYIIDAGINTLQSITLLEIEMYDTLAYDLRKINLFYKEYATLPYLPRKIYQDRKLFKSVIMTTAYSAGTASRTEAFGSYIRDVLSNRGWSMIDKGQVKDICAHLEKYFLQYVLSELPQISKFLRITRGHLSKDKMKEANMVTINMPYLSWSFSIVTTERKRFRAIFNGMPCHFTLQVPTKTIDKDAMRTTFASILIHGIDAYTVHKFFDILRQIRIELSNAEPSIPDICGYSNHDCYGVNLLYASYLIPIMQHVYNSIPEINTGIT